MERLTKIIFESLVNDQVPQPPASELITANDNPLFRTLVRREESRHSQPVSKQEVAEQIVYKEVMYYLGQERTHDGPSRPTLLLPCASTSFAIHAAPGGAI